MIESFRYIKSDLYKLKHSAFFWLHIICPVCGASLVLLYSAFATIGVENKVAAFFQILALAYPFVISIICNMVSEQEISAGNCQNILMLPCRRKVINSKLLILLSCSLFSVMISSLLFSVLLPVIGIQTKLPLSAFLVPAFVLWGSSILFYALHLLLAFRFGRNLCIGIGVLGSLLTALMQTGLGRGLWYVIPYGITIRLTECSLALVMNLSIGINKEIEIAIICNVIMTVVLIAVLIAWFSHYSGKRVAD